MSEAADAVSGAMGDTYETMRGGPGAAAEMARGGVHAAAKSCALQLGGQSISQWWCGLAAWQKPCGRSTPMGGRSSRLACTPSPPEPLLLSFNCFSAHQHTCATAGLTLILAWAPPCCPACSHFRHGVWLL